MPNKKLKVGNVPNLRFPGFEGEWKTKKLGLFIDIISGIPLQSEDIQVDESGIRILRGINITEGFIRHNKEIDRYYPKPITDKFQKFILEENDLVLGMDGSKVGKNVALISNLDVGSILIQRVAKIKALENADINFIFQKIYSERFQRYVDVVNTSSGIPHISLQQIKDFESNFPATLPEQKKVANFLSLLDQRIQTQNKIIEGLKLSKKILIKKIFNQQLSFDGRHNNNFPDWEEKKIKELFSFKITNSFSREQLNHKNGKVKNIHYGDIHTRFQTLFDIEKEEVPYINTDVNINKINEENYCAIGDMVFADASEDLIDVGKSIEIVNLNNQKLLAGLHTILARPISNTFSIGFCGYLFKSDRIRTQIQKESQGSKVLSISAVRLSNISFSIPCIEEQIIITNFLSSIDSKIDIETRFLQKLELQKKFLLQNLFV